MLSGTGTAGAYHAGVLRALHEAGVKLDVVAGVGMGVASAMYAAVDGAARLWEPNGLWRTPRPKDRYRWRTSLKVALLAVAGALAVVLLPLLLFLVAVLVYPVGFGLEILGLSAGNALARWYGDFLALAFAPGLLPTILPRVMVAFLLVLLVMLAWAALKARRASGRRRERGGLWWGAFGAPLVVHDVVEEFVTELWRLTRGVTIGRPTLADLSHSYGELLLENLGQPGFRELLVSVHDLDARRDLVFGLLSDRHRSEFFARRTGPEGERRQAELVDLAGVGRGHLADALAGALAVPVATEPHLIQFAPESAWRGERHRLCARPDALGRLIDELGYAGVDQVVLVSCVPDLPGPHTLGTGRRDPRGRLGEFLASTEAAAIRALQSPRGRRFKATYAIQPTHNPIGPFDFLGTYDDRSDRRHTLEELMEQGYQDAYGQFIDPVIGAAGEKLEGPARRPRTTKPRALTAAEGPAPEG